MWALPYRCLETFPKEGCSLSSVVWNSMIEQMFSRALGALVATRACLKSPRSSGNCMQMRCSQRAHMLSCTAMEPLHTSNTRLQELDDFVLGASNVIHNSSFQFRSKFVPSSFQLRSNFVLISFQCRNVSSAVWYQ